MSDPNSFIGQIIDNIDNKFEFVAVLVYMLLLGGIAITGMVLNALYQFDDTYSIIALFALGLGIKGVTSKIQKVGKQIPQTKIMEVK